MPGDSFVDHFKDASFLQSVIDSIEEGIVVRDHAGTIIGCNNRAMEILEISYDSLIGKNSYDDQWRAFFLDGTVADATSHPSMVALSTGEPQSNKILGIQIADRPLKWMKINARVVYSDNSKFVVTTFSDVSQLIESEKLLHAETAKLKFSEEKFTTIFRHTHIAKAITSIEGLIIDINDAACELLQYSRQELIGKHYSDITHPNDVAIAEVDVMKLINKEIRFYQGERRYYRKDGSICWGLNTVSPVFNQNGELQFFVSQIQEITELKKLNLHLEERNIELTAVQQRLEKKVSQLKDFAGIITHDVRGPAHNIKKMLEMYEASADVEIKKAAMEYLRKVSHDLTGNLNELIQILQIHLENDIPASECSFSETIESVQLQLQDLIVKKNATISVELLCTHIVYPKVYLQSIVYNLISNSLKYHTPNTPPIIHIKTSKEFGATFLKVSDNGIGIDMHKYGHLLFRFQKTFHSGYDSKGIGLYLIKNQIEDQGGTISAASEPGKGTIFTVRF